MCEHDPRLDSLGAALRGIPDEPPAAFMAAVRRRRRRVVAARGAGVLAALAIMGAIAVGIALPTFRAGAPTPPSPLADHGPSPRATASMIIPTAASVREFLDDPASLDGPGLAGSPTDAVRAGSRADDEGVRRLLTFN